MTKHFSVLALASFIVVGVNVAQAQAADPAVGQAKYQQLCVTCHGPSGKGDGVAAASLNPKPRDLTATTKTDVELGDVIAKGGAAVGLSPTMPPWGAMLTPEDIANVVAYIRTLK